MNCPGAGLTGRLLTLDRSTLCNRVGRVCWWLTPLRELMMTTLLASPSLFADDTVLLVLDPGRGKMKTDGFGAMLSIIARGTGRVIPPPFISTARIARTFIRRST